MDVSIMMKVIVTVVILLTALLLGGGVFDDPVAGVFCGYFGALAAIFTWVRF